MESKIMQQIEQTERLIELFYVKKSAIKKHERIAEWYGMYQGLFPYLKIKYEHELDIMQRAIGRINDRINRQLVLIQSNI